MADMPIAKSSGDEIAPLGAAAARIAALPAIG
jgi:hypothetical protein